MARLQVAPRATFAVDWTVGQGDCEGSYDRVLVDAPCSGLGTLRRRPELARKWSGENLAGLARAQTQILMRACERVRPGGSLIYAVCSVLREEGQEVVDSLIRASPEMVLATFEGDAARRLAADASSLLLFPHVHGTDGYFLASLRKKG
jgi:16S rRNA (cytosine967-C5)-methyltransferase